MVGGDGTPNKHTAVRGLASAVLRGWLILGARNWPCWASDEQAIGARKNWRTLRQFYAEAASEFRLFKDAWRNYAMHAEHSYTDEQARTIYDAVRAFMQHMAVGLPT